MRRPTANDALDAFSEPIKRKISLTVFLFGREIEFFDLEMPI